MQYLIIDERMRIIEKNRLMNLGYNLIEIKKSQNVYNEISSHVDIFVCKIGNNIIVEPSQYDNLKKQIIQNYNVIKGDKLKDSYPNDIKYNVCIIGKKAIHNFDYTDNKIKKLLLEQGYELINTSQGYTNCSIAVIDDNSAIVTDKGLYKILNKHGIDVLYLDYEPNIKLFTEKGYSKRKGFVGGAISKIANNIIIFGDLNSIDTDEKIRKFILNKNLNLIEFKTFDVMDYGGLIELNI